MLYLARIKKNLISGETQLQLLAQQFCDENWRICDRQSVPLNKELNYGEGLLVLVKLGAKNEIIEIEEARDWVLELVKKYLTNAKITPEFVSKERERIEQWRQELASQSQDLTRRSLEIETRREQLQELEETLMREKEKLANKLKEEENKEENNHQ